MGDLKGWHAVVTFESARGEPTCVRTLLDDSEPDVAARTAVFRALSEGQPRPFERVLIALTLKSAMPPGSLPAETANGIPQASVTMECPACTFRKAISLAEPYNQKDLVCPVDGADLVIATTSRAAG